MQAEDGNVSFDERDIVELLRRSLERRRQFYERAAEQSRNNEQSVRPDIWCRHGSNHRRLELCSERPRRCLAAPHGVRLHNRPEVGEQKSAQRCLDGPPRPRAPRSARAIPRAKRFKGSDDGFLLEVFFKTPAGWPLTERSLNSRASQAAKRVGGGESVEHDDLERCGCSLRGTRSVVWIQGCGCFDECG